MWGDALEKFKGFFKWIGGGRSGKPVEVTLIREPFSWPDASGDVCKVCGVKRGEHKSACHIFQEELL